MFKGKYNLIIFQGSLWVVLVLGAATLAVFSGTVIVAIADKHTLPIYKHVYCTDSDHKVRQWQLIDEVADEDAHNLLRAVHYDPATGKRQIWTLVYEVGSVAMGYEDLWMTMGDMGDSKLYSTSGEGKVLGAFNCVMADSIVDMRYLPLLANPGGRFGQEELADKDDWWLRITGGWGTSIEVAIGIRP